MRANLEYKNANVFSYWLLISSVNAKSFSSVGSFFTTDTEMNSVYFSALSAVCNVNCNAVPEAQFFFAAVSKQKFFSVFLDINYL